LLLLLLLLCVGMPRVLLLLLLLCAGMPRVLRLLLRLPGFVSRAWVRCCCCSHWSMLQCAAR
jgi:hypothetical protein